MLQIEAVLCIDSHKRFITLLPCARSSVGGLLAFQPQAATLFLFTGGASARRIMDSLDISEVPEGVNRGSFRLRPSRNPVAEPFGQPTSTSILSFALALLPTASLFRFFPLYVYTLSTLPTVHPLTFCIP